MEIDRSVFDLSIFVWYTIFAPLVDRELKINEKNADTVGLFVHAISRLRRK
jgi:hypothetical protein